MIGALAIMMDMKKGVVSETVKENRADELSAMFNMMTDNRKRIMGESNRVIPRRDPPLDGRRRFRLQLDPQPLLTLSGPRFPVATSGERVSRNTPAKKQCWKVG